MPSKYHDSRALSFCGVVALLAGIAPNPANGAIAIDLPRNTAGTQTGGYSLGEDFSVDAPAGIIVTNLAAFDPYDGTQNVPLGTLGYDSIPVKIYYVSGPNAGPAGTVVPGLSAVIDVTNSSFVGPDSSFRTLNSFTPVLLPQGIYRLVASNYVNEPELNVGNTLATVNSYSGPLISFPGDNTNGFNNYADINNSTAIYPTGYIDGGPINRYGAASFTFVAPEPGSALAVLGLGGVLVTARRRARR